MWPKNVMFFLLDPNFAIDPEKLNEQLARRPFQKCGGLDWFSEGFEPPAGHLPNPLHCSRGYYQFRLRREDKVLPGGVIRDHLDGRVAEIESTELRKVGRKEKLQLKEQITDDLLPRAFTRSSATVGHLDTHRGFAIIQASSVSKAENLVSCIREAIPPFPCALVRTKLSPHNLMTDWLAAGEASHGFELDAECELKDASENGAAVKAVRIDLTAEEIRQHIATGKQVTRLGLIWRERIRFVLTDQLQLKRLQFLDVLQEEASQAGDDLASLYDATFLLANEELGDLINDLVEALGGLDDTQKGGIPAPTASDDFAPWEDVPPEVIAQRRLEVAEELAVKVGRISAGTIQRHLNISHEEATATLQRLLDTGLVKDTEQGFILNDDPELTTPIKFRMAEKSVATRMKRDKSE